MIQSDLEKQLLENQLQGEKKVLENIEKIFGTIKQTDDKLRGGAFYAGIIAGLGVAGTVYSGLQLPSNFYENKDMGIGFVSGISVLALGIGIQCWYLIGKILKTQQHYLQRYG